MTQTPNQSAADDHGEGPTLVLIVHGWAGSPDQMETVHALVERTYGRGTVVINRRLPHSNPFSSARADVIVKHLIDLICATTEGRAFSRIILIGYSLGATIVRRLYLVASTRPLDEFKAEQTLTFDHPQRWAPLIERVVLISSFNRGWAISERVSWSYALMFNVVGLLGSIVPGWLPTIFDIRIGAPFVTQTRLHWIARKQADYDARRKGTPAVSVDRAVTIQIIGTRDDLVSPFDQVDLSVDGSVRAAQPSSPDPEIQPADRDYFLVEFPDTTHKTAVRLEGDAQATRRRAILEKVLVMDRAELAEIAIDPALLADEIPPVDESVANTVFVIHGIRDDGFWTHRIASRVRQSVLIGAPGQHAPGFRGWTPTYGYFAMLPFLLPWVRRQKVEWFMDQYATARAQYPVSDFDYVGHSNGTYLAARSLRDYPAFKLRNILFAGSVVRSDFDWSGVFARKQAESVQNIVAADDYVVGLLPKSVEWIKLFDLGGAGFDGFAETHGPQLTNLKYVRGSHGAGIQEVWWPSIADFIAGQTFPTSQPEQMHQVTSQRNRLLLWLANRQCVLPILALIVVIVLPYGIVHLPVDPATHVALMAVYIAFLWFVVTRV